MVCASLSAPTCVELARKARRALASGTDLVEFRLDFLREPSAHEVVKELSSFAGRGVFTFRRADEGGAFDGEESERQAVIRRVAVIQPAYFDIELRTLEASPVLARSKLGENTIVSWHDPYGTPSAARLRSLRATALSYGGLAKIVPYANSAEDNLAVLSLYDEPGPIPVAFCMGSAGLFSRVMAIECGTPLVYVSLDGEVTAKGQLPLGLALAIRRRFGF